MPILHIEHAITDFATWKQAFDRFEPERREAGVVSHTIRQPIDDDRYVVVDLDFPDAASAQRFRDFLTTRVWANPDNSPALAGEPVTSILQDA